VGQQKQIQQMAKYLTNPQGDQTPSNSSRHAQNLSYVKTFWKTKKLGMSLQNPANIFAKLRFQIPECSKDILERVNQWQHWLQLGVGQLS
jgi:hypothetical protein